MKEITKEMYEYASARIEELLPLTPEGTPAEDPNMIQLSIYSDVVERYEQIHYPIEVPTIGEVILDALDTANMSAEQLAHQIGVDISQINDLIHNKVKPSEEIANQLCRILDIKPMEILHCTGTSHDCKRLDSLSSENHSPRVLNELGSRLYREMNGGVFLEKNKMALFEKIDSRSPKAALDVEQYSFAVLVLSANEDFFIPLKNYVYNCPDIETEGGQMIEMSVDIVCSILSIPLRDMYLAAHPNFL